MACGNRPQYLLVSKDRSDGALQIIADNWYLVTASLVNKNHACKHYTHTTQRVTKKRIKGSILIRN